MDMRKDTGIKISKEKKTEMVSAIKAYYLREREEEIGELAAGFLLDFIVAELAPEFYNQGVADSYAFMEKQLEDMLAIQKQ